MTIPDVNLNVDQHGMMGSALKDLQFGGGAPYQPGPYGGGGGNRDDILDALRRRAELRNKLLESEMLNQEQERKLRRLNAEEQRKMQKLQHRSAQSNFLRDQRAPRAAPGAGKQGLSAGKHTSDMGGTAEAMLNRPGLARMPNDTADLAKILKFYGPEAIHRGTMQSGRLLSSSSGGPSGRDRIGGSTTSEGYGRYGTGMGMEGEGSEFDQFKPMDLGKPRFSKSMMGYKDGTLGLPSYQEGSMDAWMNDLFASYGIDPASPDPWTALAGMNVGGAVGQQANQAAGLRRGGGSMEGAVSFMTGRPVDEARKAQLAEEGKRFFQQSGAAVHKGGTAFGGQGGAGAGAAGAGGGAAAGGAPADAYIGDASGNKLPATTGYAGEGRAGEQIPGQPPGAPDIPPTPAPPSQPAQPPPPGQAPAPNVPTGGFDPSGSPVPKPQQPQTGQYEGGSLPGTVPETGPANLHKGEIVIPEKQVDQELLEYLTKDAVKEGALKPGASEGYRHYATGSLNTLFERAANGDAKAYRLILKGQGFSDTEVNRRVAEVKRMGGRAASKADRSFAIAKSLEELSAPGALGPGADPPLQLGAGPEPLQLGPGGPAGMPPEPPMLGAGGGPPQLGAGDLPPQLGPGAGPPQLGPGGPAGLDDMPIRSAIEEAGEQGAKRGGNWLDDLARAGGKLGGKLPGKWGGLAALGGAGAMGATALLGDEDEDEESSFGRKVGDYLGMIGDPSRWPKDFDESRELVGDAPHERVLNSLSGKLDEYAGTPEGRSLLEGIHGTPEGALGSEELQEQIDLEELTPDAEPGPEMAPDFQPAPEGEPEDPTGFAEAMQRAQGGDFGSPGDPLQIEGELSEMEEAMNDLRGMPEQRRDTDAAERLEVEANKIYKTLAKGGFADSTYKRLSTEADRMMKLSQSHRKSSEGRESSQARSLADIRKLTGELSKVLLQQQGMTGRERLKGENRRAIVMLKSSVDQITDLQKMAIESKSANTRAEARDQLGEIMQNYWEFHGQDLSDEDAEAKAEQLLYASPAVIEQLVDKMRGDLSGSPQRD